MSTACERNINYPNEINTIAQEIISDLDNDSSLSLSYVSTWLRNNIGKLNNAIGTSFVLNDSLELSPCIDNDQKDIFKWLFTCSFYRNQSKKNLGATSYDWVSIEEGDSKIRRVSKNDIAKTLMALSKDCEESLKQIIMYYKTNKALPRSLSSYNSPDWKFARVSDPHVPATFPLYPTVLPP